MVLISDRPIWFDEAFSWTLSTEFRPAEIVQRTRDVHPPLYYLLLSGWVSIFGESLFAMRSLSVLLGTSVVFVAWLVGLTVSDVVAPESPSEGDRRARRLQREHMGGLIFSGLVATSAFQIRWSGEVRMYALLSLLFLLATWFAVKAVRCEPEHKRWWIAFSLTCAAMLYTHNYGLFSVMGLSASVLLDVFFGHRVRCDQSGCVWQRLGEPEFCIFRGFRCCLLRRLRLPRTTGCPVFRGAVWRPHGTICLFRKTAIPQSRPLVEL
ncbi:MAG: DUF2723 domain-containing protein [Planctomycetaceae bacterium]